VLHPSIFLTVLWRRFRGGQLFGLTFNIYFRKSVQSFFLSYCLTLCSDLLNDENVSANNFLLMKDTTFLKCILGILPAIPKCVGKTVSYPDEEPCRKNARGVLRVPNFWKLNFEWSRPFIFHFLDVCCLRFRKRVLWSGMKWQPKAELSLFDRLLDHRIRNKRCSRFDRLINKMNHLLMCNKPF